MARSLDVEDLRLSYDPEQPQRRFIAAGVKSATKPRSERLPKPVPWPDGAAPQAAPLTNPPAEGDDLSRFAGYDAVVITYTSAEAAALAALFTPSFLPSTWYEYRHNISSYVPLVTGGRAPFNDSQPDMARYYHSLGLYFPCRIGNARVLLFKSGLHLDYDGKAVPFRKLIAEIAETVRPKLLITTGTGGGIGKQVALGDVIVAGHVRFDCTTQFKTETWATAEYATSPLPAGALQAFTPTLTKVNAAHVKGGRATPKIWSGKQGTIVTTDFFGFDDSTDYYGLQELGQACDMGDAMVGNALQDFPNIQWYAIRNASDPQIPNSNHDIKAANKEAGRIYADYGVYTTAASAIATWAILHTAFNLAPKPSLVSTGAKQRLGKRPAVVDSRTLRFGAYVKSSLPAPPASVDYGKNVPKWPMYLNDKYGDCTCAAAAHMIQNWTAAGGTERSPSNKDVLAFYSHFTTPGPENGCDMLTVLKYWRSHGLGADKIAAFTQLEPKNITEAKDAVNLFGALYIGVELPTFALQAQDLLTVPWVVPPQGPVGNAAPNPQGGHCIPAVAYDSRNLYVVTWGAVKSMSWQFYVDYADEAFAVLSTDWLTKGKTVEGYDLAQLQADLKQLGSTPASAARIFSRR